MPLEPAGRHEIHHAEAPRIVEDDVGARREVEDHVIVRVGRVVRIGRPARVAARRAAHAERPRHAEVHEQRLARRKGLRGGTSRAASTPRPSARRAGWRSRAETAPASRRGAVPRRRMRAPTITGASSRRTDSTSGSSGTLSGSHAGRRRPATEAWFLSERGRGSSDPPQSATPGAPGRARPSPARLRCGVDSAVQTRRTSDDPAGHAGRPTVRRNGRFDRPAGATRMAHQPAWSARYRPKPIAAPTLTRAGRRCW